MSEKGTGRPRHHVSAKRLTARTVYSGRIIKVVHERWRFDATSIADREIVQHPGSVVIVPIWDYHRLVLIRQFRVTVRRYLWELPAGTREAGEPLRRCALRELVEETGYRAHRMRMIARFLPSPGFCAETMYVFAAWELERGQRLLADDDPIFPRIVSFQTALSMIQRNVIVDAKTIIGITLAYPLRERFFA